jgi:hypothetical protein
MESREKKTYAGCSERDVILWLSLLHKKRSRVDFLLLKKPMVLNITIGPLHNQDVCSRTNHNLKRKKDDIKGTFFSLFSLD